MAGEGYGKAKERVMEIVQDTYGPFWPLVFRSRVYGALETAVFLAYEAAERPLREERNAMGAEMRELKDFLDLKPEASRDDVWTAIKKYRDDLALARQNLEAERATIAGLNERLTNALGEVERYKRSAETGNSGSQK